MTTTNAAVIDTALIALYNAERWLSMTWRIRDMASNIVAIAILKQAQRDVLGVARHDH